MLSKTLSATLSGIDAILVTIETAATPGATFTLVGLPDTAVKESAERVRCALQHTGFDFPRCNLVVNMSPADIKKEGSAYDLPIAIGILAADEQLSVDCLGQFMLMGELGLDGALKPIRGALPMAILARQLGLKGFILPRDNAREAAVVNNLEVYGADNLSQVVALLQGEPSIAPTVVDTRAEFEAGQTQSLIDFADVLGQTEARRALEVACAGGHNILLIGTPGSGKSMMAKRLPSILPPLTLHEALETTKIHSVAGKLGSSTTLLTARPFRSPHHTISPVALVGGGTFPTPGEISLAQNGVLYLDELPEFNRSVLEVMRQPLEDGQITISRAKYTVSYPSRFMLVASMNPCPCGYYGHPSRPCTCSPRDRDRYMNRISGPMLDRIDLHLVVEPVEIDQLTDAQPGEPSSAIRERVVRARQIQTQRFAAYPDIHCNAQMTPAMIREFVQIDDNTRQIMSRYMKRHQMSARAYDRILKVARTIADLQGSEHVEATHAIEAMNYRAADSRAGGYHVNDSAD